MQKMGNANEGTVKDEKQFGRDRQNGGNYRK